MAVGECAVTTIIVADDDPTVLARLRLYLRDSYRVVASPNRNRPIRPNSRGSALSVFDVMLPGENGLGC